MPADELWESLWADSAAEETPAAVEPLECDSLAVNISAATQRFPSNYVRERFDVSESVLLCSPCRPAGIDEQFSAAEPRSSADSGKRRRIEPQLQRPFSDDVEDDDFNLSGSSDSNSSDSNSSGSDDEAVTGPTFVEDGEFDAVHAESLKNPSRNAAKLQRAERALDDEHDAKLAADACRAAANFSCNCYVDCSLRANVNAGLIQELRRDTLREPLKCGRRTTYIAQLIYATKTATPTYMHMDEGNIRRRSDGTNVRMSQIHFVVNGMDVCSDFFCEARGLSKNLVEKAFGMANAGDMRLPKRQRSRKAFQRRLRADTGIDDSYQVAAAVEWILRHAVENGAEFMPTAHFDGRSTAEAQSARATTNQVEAALLNTSQVRLHERKVNELHRKYVEASRGLHSSVGLGVDSDPSPGGFRFVPLSYARFCKVFKEHKN